MVLILHHPPYLTIPYLPYPTLLYSKLPYPYLPYNPTPTLHTTLPYIQPYPTYNPTLHTTLPDTQPYPTLQPYLATHTYLTTLPNPTLQPYPALPLPHVITIFVFLSCGVVRRSSGPRCWSRACCFRGPMASTRLQMRGTGGLHTIAG